jgi:hypothetical protein
LAAPFFADDFFADDFFFAVAIESLSLVGDRSAVKSASCEAARLGSAGSARLKVL